MQDSDLDDDLALLVSGQERNTERLRNRVYVCLICSVMVGLSVPLALTRSATAAWVGIGMLATSLVGALFVAEWVVAPVYALRKRLEIKNFGTAGTSEDYSAQLDLGANGFQIAPWIESLTPRQAIDVNAPLPMELAAIERLAHAGPVHERAMDSIKGEVLRGLSHSMKTPLAIMHSHSEIARKLIESGDTYGIDERLAAIQEVCKDAADLVSKSLSYLDVQDERRHTASFKPVDVSVVLSQVLASRRGTVEAHGMALQSNIEAGLWVRGDHQLLVEAVATLVDNAVRYAHGGRTIFVDAAKLKGRGELVMLSVTDQGPGIPVHERDRVLLPFYGQVGTDSEGRTLFGHRQGRSLGVGMGNTSHGLGLAFVKSVTKLLGAQLTLGQGPAGVGLKVELVLDGTSPLMV